MMRRDCALNIDFVNDDAGMVPNDNHTRCGGLFYVEIAIGTDATVSDLICNELTLK